MPHSAFTHVCLRSPGCAPWEAAGQRLQGRRNGTATPGQRHEAEFASEPSQRLQSRGGLAGELPTSRCRSQRGAPAPRPGSGCARRGTGFWQRPEPSVEHEVMSAPYPCLEACPSPARGEETCPKGAERRGSRGNPPRGSHRAMLCRAMPCRVCHAMSCHPALHPDPAPCSRPRRGARGCPTHCSPHCQHLTKLPVMCDPTGLNVSALSCKFLSSLPLK